MSDKFDWPDLTVARYRVTLTAREAGRLPGYLGSTLRGAFGHAFRRVACALPRQECDTCLLRFKCPYAYVFETPVPPDSPIMRRYPAAPHPFVIEPPWEAIGEVVAGDTFIADLILIGSRANELLPYFVYSLDRMAERGLGKARIPFDLVRVEAPLEAPRTEGLWKVIYRKGDDTLRTPPAPVSMGQLASSVPLPSRGTPEERVDCRLDLITPARIKFQERLADDLPCHLLIRSLVRRLSTLAAFHGGGLPAWDAGALVEAAEQVEQDGAHLRWLDWERYSSRQRTRMSLGGMVGQVTYRRVPAPVAALLRIGETLHVGKATAFGLGRYEMEIER